MGTNAIIHYNLSLKLCILTVNHAEVVARWYLTSLILNGLFYLRVLDVDADLSDSSMVLNC